MLTHLLTTLATLLRPGWAGAIIADSLLMKQQLVIINRSRRRTLNLIPIDRMLLRFWSLFFSPRHIRRSAIILRPFTLPRFLDHSLFRNVIDLERKLADVQTYYNHHRTHNSFGGNMPAEVVGDCARLPIKLVHFRWQTHC